MVQITCVLGVSPLYIKNFEKGELKEWLKNCYKEKSLGGVNSNLKKNDLINILATNVTDTIYMFLYKNLLQYTENDTWFWQITVKNYLSSYLHVLECAFLETYST